MRSNHKTLHYHALLLDKVRTGKDAKARAEFANRMHERVKNAVIQGQRVIHLVKYN